MVLYSLVVMVTLLMTEQKRRTCSLNMRSCHKSEQPDEQQERQYEKRRSSACGIVVDLLLNGLGVWRVACAYGERWHMKGRCIGILSNVWKRQLVCLLETEELAELAIASQETTVSYPRQCIANAQLRGHGGERECARRGELCLAPAFIHSDAYREVNAMR